METTQRNLYGGNGSCSQQDIKYVEEKIKDIINRMNALYSVTNATDSEYNEYLGAEYIKVISSNHITEGINILLYTAIGAVLVLGTLDVSGPLFLEELVI